ncbi:MAG: hypothetical protein AAFQ12_09570 [Pseudomonadota bacterium]
MDNLFLLRLATLFSGHTGYTLTTVGTYATSDGAFFKRIENGGDCTTQRAKRIAQWFDAHWPDDLEWPADIPRPTGRDAA